MVYADVYAIVDAIRGKTRWQKKLEDSAVRERWKREGGSDILFDLAVAAMELMDTYEPGSCCGECCRKVRSAVQKEMDPKQRPEGASGEDGDGGGSSDSSWDGQSLLDVQARHCECPCAACGPGPSDNTVAWSKVVVKDGVVSDGLRQELLQQVALLESNIPLDWQPGFEGTLRNLFHPSMYCFVEGETLVGQPPPAPADPELGQASYVEGRWFRHEEMEPVNKYRWLPSEFQVRRESGRPQVRITSPINNLDRRRFPGAYAAIAKVFSRFVPLFEEVLGVELGGQIQVIVKMSSTQLTAEAPRQEEGKWHLEGVPAERILASGLYYYDVEGISDSSLRFRQPLTDVDPHDYRQDDPRAWQDYGLTAGDTLNRVMGEVRVKDGRCVVFPNVVQHSPSACSLQEGAARGHRKLLCFFLVNPETTVLSTRHVGVQQAEILVPSLKALLCPLGIPRQLCEDIAGFVTIPHEVAVKNRAALMKVRSEVQASADSRIFQRPVSLCEH